MILVIEPDPATRTRFVEHLQAPQGVVEVDTLTEADLALQRSAASISCLVLGSTLAREAALAFAEKTGQRDAVGVVLVADVLDSDVLRQALRAGVDDVLTPEADATEWQESVGRARSRTATARGHRHGEGDERGEQGRVMSVFSTKGGVGKSMVASNLAVLAAQRSERPIGLVDMDLQAGDLGIMLQLTPGLSIHDAARNVAHLDVEAMEGYFTPHNSGVRLLAAPSEPSLADQVTPASVETMLGLLRTLFPLTIVDGPSLFTDQMLTALDYSDEIVLVGSMEVPSIKNLKAAINTIYQLGHNPGKVRVVMNRATSKVGLQLGQVEKTLGVEIDVRLPSSRDVPVSVNQADPLALGRPKSPVVTAIAGLLPDLGEQAAAQTKRGRRRQRR